MSLVEAEREHYLQEYTLLKAPNLNLATGALLNLNLPATPQEYSLL